jgi:hypothetical protein
LSVLGANQKGDFARSLPNFLETINQKFRFVRARQNSPSLGKTAAKGRGNFRRKIRKKKGGFIGKWKTKKPLEKESQFPWWCRSKGEIQASAL